MGREREISIAVLTAALNIGADRVTKAAAAAFLKGGRTLSYLSGSVVLGYTENRGAFLSLGSGWPLWLKSIVLLYIPLLVCLGAFVYCLVWEADRKRIVLVASIAAGGAANLFDRIANGFAVVDFMNFGIGSLRTGILNVADLSITFGAIGLAIYEARRGKRA